MKWLRSEQGSQSILGIGTATFVLCLTLVVASATQLSHQQRQLQSVGDSLALDLADLLQFNAKEALKNPDFVPADVPGSAASELSQLAISSNRGVRLANVNLVAVNEVSVTVCQANSLGRLPLIGGLVGHSEICAKAAARTQLP